VLYLDSCAAIKLVKTEPETTALVQWLDAHDDPTWVTSVIGEVEIYRKIAAIPELPELATAIPALMDDIIVIELTAEITTIAKDHPGQYLRGMDAFHLATALYLRDNVSALVTYDERLAKYATAEGLAVVSPGNDRI
jgi:predicted nucleic acid-binding protein